MLDGVHLCPEMGQRRVQILRRTAGWRLDVWKEGSSIFSLPDEWFLIHYCPFCGKKLEEESDNG